MTRLHAALFLALMQVLPAGNAPDARLRAKTLADDAYRDYNRGAMADALAKAQAAYRISGETGDRKLQLEALAVIAHVYADAQVAQYDRAIEYYRQLLPEYEKLKQPADVADTLFNIGSTYEQKGDLAAAERNFRSALTRFEALGRADDVAYTKRALGLSLMKQGRAADALPMLDAALAFYARARDEESIAMTRQFRGMTYRRLARFDEALRDLEAARAFYEKQNNVRYLEKNAEETAQLYAQRGDWRNAYDAARRHAALRQTLAETRRDELSSRLRVEFDAEKKDRENRALARENALRATALREAERRRTLQILVSALTALLAVALALLFWRQVAHTRRMGAMAMTDELTRLPNRRHILAAADIAFDAAKRDGRATAVVVLDIDRFKQINDAFGHAVGDQVLQAVARTCRLELRAGDQLGRIGGEEFLAVLDSATGLQAAEVAERLRAGVERLEFAGNLRVTISLGVHVARQYDAGAAIAAADALLYRAKEGGRNRVVAGS